MGPLALLFGSHAPGNLGVDLGLLALRLHAGYVIMGAGLSKFPQPSWVVDQVAGMGFPLPTFFAFMASGSEFIGGALIILGLLTRPAALLVAFTMGVAAFKFHGITPLTGLHIAQVLFWIYLALFIAGPGRISLDRLIVSVLRPASGRPARRFVVPLIVLPVLAVLFGTATYRQVWVPLPEPVSDTNTIESISVAGSFNDWDPTATPMQSGAGSSWSVIADVPRAGLIEFKFAANGGWDINAGLTEPGGLSFPLTGTATLDGGGDTINIQAYIPAPGPVVFTFDTDTFNFTVGPPAIEPASDNASP